MEEEIEKTPEQQIDDAIKEQTAGTSHHQVFVLEFNNIPFKKFTLDIKNKIERFREVQFLSLINCELESLENFPRLPHLIRLDLVANSIKEDSLKYLQHSTQLQTLILSHNEINNLDTINVLSTFKSLVYIDLFGNPVQELMNTDTYRKTIFDTFKSLKILDSEDKKGNFAEEKSDEILQRVASNLLEVKKPTKAQIQVIKKISKTQVQQVNIAQEAQIQKKQSIANIQQEKPKPKKKQQNQQQQQQQQQIVVEKKKTARELPKRTVSHGGKGKAQTYSTRNSDSQKSGLTFPCGRIGRYLKQQNKSHRISKYSKVYMGAVLEYLCAEVVELAGIVAKQNKKKRILPNHIRMAMRGDEEISKFVPNTVISESGGVSTNFDGSVFKSLSQKKSAKSQ